MGNSITRSVKNANGVLTSAAEICDSQGNTIFIVLNRPVVPSGYFIDPRSTNRIRIYKHRKADRPVYIFYRYRSFSDAIHKTRRRVLRSEQEIDM